VKEFVRTWWWPALIALAIVGLGACAAAWGDEAERDCRGRGGELIWTGGRYGRMLCVKRGVVLW
jgi:hypothetical protein